MLPEVEEFLKEYKDLCKKTGLYIKACGCCDSPWISRLHPLGEDFLDEHIEHLSKQHSHNMH